MGISFFVTAGRYIFPGGSAARALELNNHPVYTCIVVPSSLCVPLCWRVKLNAVLKLP